MKKMIKVEKQWFGGYHLTVADKVNFYIGTKSIKSPGIGISLDLYDRSLSFDLLYVYFGVEVYHKE